MASRQWKTRFQNRRIEIRLWSKQTCLAPLSGLSLQIDNPRVIKEDTGMSQLNISDYTEAEFLEFLNKICRFEYTTEKKLIRAVLLFDELTEHPDGSDLIYYADSDEDSTPEAIIEKVKVWRAANGKPGFKIEE